MQSPHIGVPDFLVLNSKVKSGGVELPVSTKLPTEFIAQADSLPVPQSYVGVEISQVSRQQIQPKSESSSNVSSVPVQEATKTKKPASGR